MYLKDLVLFEKEPAQRAGQSPMFQKVFQQNRGNHPFLGANVDSFVSLLSQRELRVSKFGLKCMKVC